MEPWLVIAIVAPFAGLAAFALIEASDQRRAARGARAEAEHWRQATQSNFRTIVALLQRYAPDTAAELLAHVAADETRSVLERCSRTDPPR